MDIIIFVEHGKILKVVSDEPSTVTVVDYTNDAVDKFQTSETSHAIRQFLNNTEDALRDCLSAKRKRGRS